METKETNGADFTIDFKELFRQTVANPSQALVSLLELRFHDLFEAYRNGKADPKEIKRQIKEYLVFEAELFDKLFRGKFSQNLEHYAHNPEQEEAFLKNILEQIRRPGFFKNPMHYFFDKHLKKYMSFENYQIIRRGEFTPSRIRHFVELFTKWAQKDENRKFYLLLKSFSGDSPEASRFFMFLLLKAAFESCKVDTENFKPEHVPLSSKSVIQSLREHFSHLFGRGNPE